MRNNAARYISFEDNDIECVFCGVVIPEVEYLQWDEKYQESPKCEDCFRSEDSE